MTVSERVSLQEARTNGILSKLPEEFLASILPHLRRVHLPRNAVLEISHHDINRIYFPIGCVASVIAVGRDGTRIETGLVGREGMSGTGLAIGDNLAAQELVNQIKGSALEMVVDDFRNALELTPYLGLLTCRFARSLTIQASHTALANASLKIHQRLARWLLMVDDRVSGNSFDLTHKYLAIMLGVRRSSVTDALHILEGERLIRSSRNNIEIRDRRKLVKYAGATYGIPEQELKRLMALPNLPASSGSIPDW